MSTPAVFTEAMIQRNCDALLRAQGMCPPLAGLQSQLARAVTDERHGIRVEIRTRDNHWRPLDGHNPAADAAERIAPVAGERQIVLVGLGLGFALDTLDASGSHAKVLAIEPDPAVATLWLARRDWSSWIDSGRLRVLTGPDYAGATTVAAWLDVSTPPAVSASTILSQERPRSTAGARAIAERVIGDANANAEARRRFAGRYLMQTLGNLPTILSESDVSGLDGLFPGTPAVVVGAGPSLDRNVESLRRLQDRVVIVAADTTLRPLLAGGVRPHFVVGVDPSELNARHLAGVQDVGDVWLVAEGSLHAPAFESFGGRVFTFKVSAHEPWPWLQAQGVSRGNLRAWGSVITSAFDLALRMGCDPVVFAGLDLAFTGERPYCTNTIYDREWQAAKAARNCTDDELAEHHFNQRPTIWDLDLRGARIRTATHLVSFRNWLLDQIARTPGRRFVNATDGGMLYGKGVEQATLAEVLGTASARAAIRDRIREAWERGRTVSSPVASALGGLVSEDSDASAVMDRWRAFTLETVDVASITAAVSGVLAGLP